MKTTHGEESNYEATIAHLIKVRAAIKELKIELIDLVVDGVKSKFASRHVSYVKRTDGGEATVEVGLFGSFDAEGKFTYVYEMSRAMD